MGVIRQSGTWTVSKTSVVAGKGQEIVSDQITKVIQTITQLKGMLPTVKCSLVSSGVGSIISILEKIGEISVVAWTNEKLYALYSSLWGAVEDLILLFTPWITTPYFAVVDLLKMVSNQILGMIVFSFDMVDDRMFSPVYRTCADVTSASFNFTKDVVVSPIVGCISGTVVKPTLRVMSSVKSSAISTTAWVDKKTSLVGLLLLLVEKTRQADQCVTRGLITNRVLLPVVTSGVALDSLVTGGMVKQLVDDSLIEWKNAKGGNVPIVKGSVVQRNVTSAGPPQMRR